MRWSETVRSVFAETGQPIRLRHFRHLTILLACAAVFSGSGCEGRRIRGESPDRPVLFTYAGAAKRVCLSGDFNAWSPDSDCLRREGARWEIRIFLPPGRYRYGFLLDDKDWIPDPGALLQEADGFGRNNSVLVVE
jgi:hypothetical protein